MSRKKKLFLNTGTAVLYQIATLVCGLIIPRLIISFYGSTTNGLISSITHFLAFFSLMEMGVSSVVRASLYKPLAENDHDSISRVLISSRRFFRKIGLMLLIYSLALMAFFPIFVDHSHGYLSTAVLVGAMAFSSLANYLFGIVYQQLLNADQKSYVQIGASLLTLILNTGFAVVLIYMGASIEVVKVAAAIVLLLRPLILKLYVDRHYKVNFKLKLEGEPIKQKWNGLAQHIAIYVLKHADVVILTLFSTLDKVSVYNVYHLVTNGLQQMIEVMTTGMQSLLGNMYVKKETDKLEKTFSSFELLMHLGVTILYTIAGIMIIPFVKIYTKNVTDAEYIVPVFAILIVTANASYCLRMPYYMMTQAAGHFKETQASSILEAAMNVVISIILVNRFGLIGVAIGTLAAMTYRTIYLAWYLRKHILNRPFIHFIKHIIVDIFGIGLSILATWFIPAPEVAWGSWILISLIVALIVSAIIILINFICFRHVFASAIKMLFKKADK